MDRLTPELIMNTVMAHIRKQDEEIARLTFERQAYLDELLVLKEVQGSDCNKLRRAFDEQSQRLQLMSVAAERLQGYADAHPCDHMPVCERP